MRTKSRRVLITGIHGFTGRYLSRMLVGLGHQVFGIGMVSSSEAGYFQADLTDFENLKDVVTRIKPNWVVHLAGISFVGHKNPNDHYRINLICTRNLLAALSENNPLPVKIILAGSANIYGRVEQEVISEDTVPNPPNDYAVSKLAIEYMARLWIPRLPLIITRPFNYTGIGQSTDFVLPKIVDHFKRKASVIELGNLDISRDFNDVRFVAEVYSRLLEKSPAGEVVNICSGRATSLQYILGCCKSITGHNIEVRVNPDFVRADDIKTLRGDPRKLKAILGDFDPPPIEQTLQWMLSDGKEHEQTQ
ncbi:GDP-mannose 4,6-dehydratase [Desulfobacter postgatei]|uniref:GDP-mannose 4,6-dehydratase n=1 Tax=Desulfobacter postgatei TaxID=2293 RepID=UPI00259B1FA4|nr:GDP-mannose 4,6-dehydratase [uncultured Desulfobacter sp.]